MTTTRADARPVRARRALLGCLALVIAVLASPVQAHALGIEAIPPPVVDTGGPNVVAYRVTFSAGATEERFRLEVSPPRSIDGGYTMQLVGSPEITGEGGANVYLSSPGPPYFGCSSIPGQQGHGYTATNVSADVGVAPGGHLTFTFQFRTGDLPLRPGDSLSPRMLIPFHVGETPPPFGPIAWPEPARSGPVGVSFSLHTKPGGAAAVLSDPSPPPFLEVTLQKIRAKRIRRGVPIDIVGNTTPALSRQKIDLIYTGPRHLQPKRLARVRTDAKGRFRLFDWKPKRPGGYEISAVYTSQLPEIRSDYAACSKSLLVGRPK
jgi:hypothetical protein